PQAKNAAQFVQEALKIPGLLFQQGADVHARGSGAMDGDDVPDLGEAEPEAASAPNEGEHVEHGLGVQAIPGRRAARGGQNPPGFIDQECLAAESALGRHLTDPEPLRHALSLRPAPRGRVKRYFRGVLVRYSFRTTVHRRRALTGRREARRLRRGRRGTRHRVSGDRRRASIQAREDRAMADFTEHPYIPTLTRQLAERLIDRREFLRAATLLGMSAGAAYALAGSFAGEPWVRPALAQGTLPRGGTFRIGMRCQDLKSPHTYSWIESANSARQVLDYLTVTGV